MRLTMRRAYIGFFVSLIFGIYLSLSTSLWDAGLGQLDAHGILKVVNDQIINSNSGEGFKRISVSRPPGHPLTENWLYPWLFSSFHQEKISDPAYAQIQTIWGAITLSLFIGILFQLGFSIEKIFVASIAVIFSTDFMEQSTDGEEFLIGVSFVLLGWWLLILADGWLQRSEVRRWNTFILLMGAGACFGISTGARLEYLPCLILGLLFFVKNGYRLKFCWVLLGSYLLVWTFVVFVVWSPLLMSEKIGQPFPIHLDSIERATVALYKLAFHVYSPVLIVLGGCFMLPVFARKRIMWREWSCLHFSIISAFAIVLIYHLLFIRYPTKSAFLLISMPALWILLLYYGRFWQISLCAVLFVIHAFVRFDPFDQRVYQGIHFTEGHYLETVQNRPRNKQTKIIELSQRFSKEDLYVVTPFWTWDFDFVYANKMLPDRGILHDRSSLTDLEKLREIQESGKRIYVEETMFRKEFYRLNPYIELDSFEFKEGIYFYLYQL